MNMKPALLILAAGIGSRYGGLKQLDAVGPSGETMLDYAVFDARREGFDRVVFVIRRDFEAEFRARIGARYARSMRVDYVFQEIEALPAGFAASAGRVKPWGTGHAVWCARTVLDGPFAVINADDFYGRDAYVQLDGFLRAGSGSGAARFALIGFRLAETLSGNGSVARGLCKVARDGALRSVIERTGIVRAAVGPGREFSGEEIVSMNCWGFTPDLFPLLERRLVEFLRQQQGADPKAEFYLPTAVSSMVTAGQATVSVLPTRAQWFGVTYREDKPRVAAAIRALVAVGEYPSMLESAGRLDVVS